MTDDQKDCFQSTPPGTLERQIMDPGTPKNEREHWAAAEIARLRPDAERLDWIANHGGCPFAETDTVWDDPTEFRRALDEQIAHLEGRDSTR